MHSRHAKCMGSWEDAARHGCCGLYGKSFVFIFARLERLKCAKRICQKTGLGIGRARGLGNQSRGLGAQEGADGGCQQNVPPATNMLRRRKTHKRSKPATLTRRHPSTV